MSNLYEIEQDIAQAIENMLNSVNEETGEVDESCVKALEDLKIQKDKKLEAIGCVIKNLRAEAALIKAEEDIHQAEADACKERRESKEKHADRLAKYVASILNGEKWESPKVAFSFRKSDKLVIDDEQKLPKKWFKVKETVDKTALKKAIKEGKAGVASKYARIVEQNNIQVK